MKASSLTKQYFAVGEFSVLTLLQYHFSACQFVCVASEKEGKKYLSYKAKIIVNPKLIKQLSKKGDIYAIASFIPYPMKLTHNVHLLINNLDDLGEIGTIIRTALCFDIKDIVLINSNVDLFARQIIRASAGAFFMANIVQYKNKSQYQREYPNNKTIEFTNKKAPLSLEVGAKLYQFYNAR